MSRRWLPIAATLFAVAFLSGAYYFLWPHRHRLTGESARPAPSSVSQGKPSPLSQAPPVQGQLPLPSEHMVPPPAPAVAPPEQTPQSLGAMIQSLATQSGSVVRVVNVKHDGGDGCRGVLVFTLDEFRFECSSDGSETFRISRGDVGQVHKNGVQVWKSVKGKKLGRRYHFSMVGRSKDLVKDVFEEWMRLRPG